MYKEEKELWVKFACAALSAIVSDGAYDNDFESDCDIAAEYADRMLHIFKDKFEKC